MALQAFINEEAYNNLDATLQAEYRQDNDGYILDVIAVNGLTLANQTEVQNALNLERRKVKDVTKTLNAYKVNGELMEPAKFKNLMEKVDEIDSWDPDDKLAEHKAQFEAQLQARFDTQLAEAVTKHENEIGTLRSDFETVETQLRNSILDSTANQAINKAEGISSLLLPMIKANTKIEVDEQTGQRRVVVLDANGNVRMSTQSTNGTPPPMNLEEYVAELRANKEFAGAFRGSGAAGGGGVGGSGGAGSGGAGGGTTVNPFMRETFNMTQQMDLYRNDRVQFDAMKNAAAKAGHIHIAENGNIQQVPEAVATA